MYSTSPLEASGKPARSVIEALAQSNSKWPVVEPNGGLPAIVSPMNVCAWDPAMRSESPTYPLAGPDQGIRFDTSNVTGVELGVAMERSGRPVIKVERSGLLVVSSINRLTVHSHW